jgi:hypothetical protein
LAISIGEEIFLEISSIASELSNSASATGIESASGKTNSTGFLVELLQEKRKSAIMTWIKNNLPIILMRDYHLQKYKNSGNLFINNSFSEPQIFKKADSLA